MWTSRGMELLPQRSLSSVGTTQEATLITIAACSAFLGLLDIASAIRQNHASRRWEDQSAVAKTVGTCRAVMTPFLALPILLHELCHAIAAICTCGRVKDIGLNLRAESGFTKPPSGVPVIVVPAGHLGTALIGGGLLFCGFDIVASKIASIVVGGLLVPILWWTRKQDNRIHIISVLILHLVLLVIGWFFYDAEVLRYFVLIMGTTVCYKTLYGIGVESMGEEPVGEKSDISTFAEVVGVGSEISWGIVWFLVSSVLIGCGIVAGIAVFDQPSEQQRMRSHHFLPVPSVPSD